MVRRGGKTRQHRKLHRRRITHKKPHVRGGKPPGLKINTSTYDIPTSLTKKEIKEHLDILYKIENMNESYGKLEIIIVGLLNKPGAIGRETDVIQLEMLKYAAEKHHDKPRQIANVLISVLERFTPKD
jgi:hypothetical protein